MKNFRKDVKKEIRWDLMLGKESSLICVTAHYGESWVGFNDGDTDRNKRFKRP